MPYKNRAIKLEKDQGYYRAIAVQRRSNGLCVKCGEPAREGLSQCQKCADRETQRTVEYRRRLKAKAVEYLGGKCIDCGLQSEYVEVYDFHHKLPEEKSGGIASFLGAVKRWKRIQEERDKCVLLCSNRHRIRHAKEDRQLSP